MSIPSVLLSGVRNESQDLQITTDVLEPNILNSSQAVFVIPKKASVLDSKSALKLKVNWPNADFGNDTVNVGGKLFSGMLGLVKNARLYASGQLISRLDHAGEKIHLDNQFKSQEYKEQYCDVKHSSNTGFLVADELANSGLNGAIKNDDFVSSRSQAEPPVLASPNYFRGVGKVASATDGDNGVEMFLLLEEIFPMLKDIQLPVRFLKDEIRIEIDFETDNTKWLMSSPDPHANAGVAQAVVTEAVMFLDYITYNEEIDASLAATLETTGVSIPFRETAIITTALGGEAGAVVGKREDVLIGQEGRAVMKVFVAKRYPDTLTGITNNVNSAYSYQGHCRSDALMNQKFNFVVNDLLIYDRDVENPKESYNYFCFTGEKQASCYPDAWEQNDTYGAQSVTNDVLYTTDTAGANDQPILGNAQVTGAVKDGIRGTQNWDSVDLSKYGKGGLNPSNAMRIGSTPIIYRLTRDTGANVRDRGAVQITVFVEYLRLFDLRAGDLAVRDL